jgi:hypothetical protein
MITDKHRLKTYIVIPAQAGIQVVARAQRKFAALRAVS